MLYVVEPGALSQIARGECGAPFKDLLVDTLKALATNPNAEMYLDVAYSTLTVEAETKVAVTAIQSMLATEGVRIKGFALNTADYETTEDMTKLCGNFIAAFGEPLKNQFTCVIDTSRNLNGPSKSHKSCNLITAGIGQPPQSRDEKPVAYYMWNKVPGESDGECLEGNTNKVMAESVPNGLAVGDFFPAHFEKLWAQGYLAKNNITNSTIADTEAYRLMCRDGATHISTIRTCEWSSEPEPVEASPAPAHVPAGAVAPAPEIRQVPLIAQVGNDFLPAEVKPGN